MFRARAVFILLLLTGGTASASGGPEGEYAITYTPQSSGPKVSQEQFSQCLSEKSPVPRPPAKAGSCKVSDATALGEAVLWRLECSGAEGGGALNLGGEHFSGTLSLQSGKQGRGMPVTWFIEGRRVGACGAKPNRDSGSGPGSKPEPEEPPDVVPPPPAPPVPAAAPPDNPDAPERFYSVDKWEVQLDEKIIGEASRKPLPDRTCTANADLSAKGKGTLYSPPRFGRKSVSWEGELQLDTRVSEKWQCHVPAEKHSYGFEQRGSGAPKKALARLSIDAKRKTYTFQILNSGQLPLKGTHRFDSHSTTIELDQHGALDFIDEHRSLPPKGFELWSDFSGLPSYNMSMSGMMIGPFARQGAYSLRPVRISVCGPDITPALEQTLANVREHFAKLNTFQRAAVCNNLLSPSVGVVAWDIAHLHAGLEWLEQVRPECATVGDKPACEKTVQVNDQCFYVGSVNYVVFGVMMRLCHDSQPVQAPFGLTATEVMVRGYKGIPGMTAGNLEPSVQWSVAGFNGWPGAPTPPGDRKECRRECPREYLDRVPHKADGSLPVIWLPYLNF